MTILGSKLMDLFLPWTQGKIDPGMLQKRRDDEASSTSDCIQFLDLESVEKLLEGVSDLLQSDEDRRSSVDSRLTTMVGLASIAATLVTGIVIAQVSATLKIESPNRWIIACVVLYLVLQLCDAIGWALHGLCRKGYWSLTVGNYLPTPLVSRTERLRVEVIDRVKMLHDNREITNQKVTAMAVAHQAALNFAVGLFLLAVVGLCSIPSVVQQNDVLDALKTDANLRTMLRGSQGPPGPQGATGPQGPRGETGPAGKSSDRTGSRQNGQPAHR